MNYVAEGYNWEGWVESIDAYAHMNLRDSRIICLFALPLSSRDMNSWVSMKFVSISKYLSSSGSSLGAKVAFFGLVGLLILVEGVGSLTTMTEDWGELGSWISLSEVSSVVRITID